MENKEFKEGSRFGKLVITGKDNGLKGGYKRYECKCDCGNTTWVYKQKLISGHTRSCGCMTTRKSRFDITTLIPYVDKGYPDDVVLLSSGKARMNDKIHCVCRVCGKAMTYRAIKHFFDYPDHFCTCAKCVQKETSTGGKKGFKQSPENRGLKRDYPRLYTIWTLMNKRCTDPRNRSYSLYGEKGIRVCDEWESLQVFINWALQNGYKEDLTIDRIDPTGNYTPDNCRWTDYTTQNRNKTITKYINGLDSKTFFESTEHHPSVSYIRFYMRYYSSGWSLEDSLNIPNKGRSTKLSTTGIL